MSIKYQCLIRNLIMKPDEKVKVILNDIWRMSTEELFQDLTIICKDGIIRTNGFVLSLMSPVIHKLLNDIPGEEDICISLPDISSQNLHGFIENVLERRNLFDNCEISFLLTPFKAESVQLRSNVILGSSDEESVQKSESFDFCKEEVSSGSDAESDPDFEELDPVDGGAGKKTGNDRKQNIQSKKYPRECLICQSLFENKQEYLDHIKEHRKSFDPQETPACPKCGKTFSKSYKTFTMHVRRCKPAGKPDPCWICQATFESKAEYDEHIKSHEEGFSPPICQHCGKTPKIKGNTLKQFRKHLRECRRRRGVEGLRYCSYCYKMVSQVLWTEHRMVCKKKRRKEMCNICGKEFTDVKSHTKNVHELLSLQPKTVFCDICGKGFVKKDGLLKHLQIHKETLPCPQCGIKVRNVDNHIKAVHTPDELKSHRCPDCGKGFIYSQILEKHRMSVHLKLRPYRCRYGCADSYNEVSNRNQHEKKKHGKLFITAIEEKKRKMFEESQNYTR